MADTLPTMARVGRDVGAPWEGLGMSVDTARFARPRTLRDGQGQEAGKGSERFRRVELGEHLVKVASMEATQWM